MTLFRDFYEVKYVYVVTNSNSQSYLRFNVILEVIDICILSELPEKTSLK